MSAYFVTATGTDIGKTFVTAGLVRHYRAEGKSVSALKPLVSGFSMERAAASDPGVLLAGLGQPITHKTLDHISPWRFAAPLSPDMAAAREHRSIDFDAMLTFCRKGIAKARGTLFIEGVGGVMVPLDDNYTVLDWMIALRLPVILVAGTYLGTISHTLTALDVLKRAKLEVAALVLNHSGAGTVPIEDTRKTLIRFVAGIPIATLPRVTDADAARAEFVALAKLLQG